MTHRCLSCSCEITEGQDEIKVPEKGSTARYVHEHYEDCQAAEKQREMSKSGRSERIRKRSGHVANLPGLDEMEEWD